ncbi:MAG: hypothetical protein GF416_09385 [Candidatus Altiarchaeales archaeon]|nr:hypothetical protein [Candidatus Altiarchaeales archaeon]MBD3417332.1 hypothetical protein [Candidatus Altiarchaeales archaeon]
MSHGKGERGGSQRHVERPAADLDCLLDALIRKRVDRNLETVTGPAREGDVGRIMELAAAVGPATGDLRGIISSLAVGVDPGRAGYSYRLTVMKPGEESPVEGYNLTRVRAGAYPMEQQLGLGYKSAGSLSTSFGGPAHGGGTILAGRVMSELEGEGIHMFWSRANAEMRPALEHLGFEEASLPSSFVDAEREAGLTIYSRNMDPMEVAYEYFRGQVTGSIGYTLNPDMQVGYEGLTNTLDDWIGLRGLRVSQGDARRWLGNAAEKVSGRRPRKINATPDICSAVSTAVYADAVNAGRERYVRWDAGGGEPMEYHPLADMSYFSAYYLARGDRLRDQVIQAGARGQPLQTYDFVRDKFFNGNEFGTAESIERLENARK